MTVLSAPGTVTDRLSVVAVDQLVLHEAVEARRLQRVTAAIRADATVRNPVLVTALAGDRWLVVDGAHRTSALRAVGASHALVQVLRPGDCDVLAWHRVLEPTAADVPVADLVRPDCPACDAGAGRCLARVETPGATGHLWCAADDVVAASDLLPAVAGRWRGLRSRRIAATEPTPDGHLRLAYQPWSLDRIRALATRERVLPAGLTRFVVPGRILGVDLPLALLTGRACAADGAFAVRDHLAHRRFRYYAEPVYLAE
jgi:L-serine kinase (ATP) / ParB family transcriptional regulator, heme-responsive regulator